MNIRKSHLYRQARRMLPLGDRKKTAARKLRDKQKARVKDPTIMQQRIASGEHILDPEYNNQLTESHHE